MARIAVTGAAGFIGSHLAEALVRRGDDVIGIDNFDPFYDIGIKQANLAELHRAKQFELVEADIRDASAMTDVLSGIDAVVHLAARAGVRPSIEDPQGYQDVNIRGTMALLEACRVVGRPRFIFASSSSVYGNNDKVPFSEADAVNHPMSPYAATKRAAELLCYTYHHLWQLPMSCLRFFTVYGPRQRPDLAVHKFARLMLGGAPIPMFGDGSMERDLTYIDDIVNGVVRSIDRCGDYRIYNLGESCPVSVKQLIAALERALGVEATIERRPVPPGDVRRTFADVSLARQELGYEPSTSLEVGLEHFVKWLRSQPEHGPNSLTTCR